MFEIYVGVFRHHVRISASHCFRISNQLAEHYQSQRDFVKAVKFYREASDYDESNPKVTAPINVYKVWLSFHLHSAIE